MTCSVLVLLFMLFKSGDVQIWKDQKNVHLLFNYISGLEVNAPVHFSGHKVGKVTGIEFVNSAESSKIQVTLAVDKNVPVRADSQAFIDVLGFMGEKLVELSPGTPQAALYDESSTLTGTDPVPMMKIVKDGTELLAEFQKIADSLKVVLKDVQGITGRNEKNLDEIFTNLNASSGNLKEMTHDLKLHPWKLLKKDKSGKKKKFLIV